MVDRCCWVGQPCMLLAQFSACAAPTVHYQLTGQDWIFDARLCSTMLSAD